jgi:hypothetical protein
MRVIRTARAYRSCEDQLTHYPPVGPLRHRRCGDLSRGHAAAAGRKWRRRLRPETRFVTRRSRGGIQHAPLRRGNRASRRRSLSHVREAVETRLLRRQGIAPVRAGQRRSSRSPSSRCGAGQAARLARRKSPALGLSAALLLRWRGTRGLVKPASQVECPSFSECLDSRAVVQRHNRGFLEPRWRRGGHLRPAGRRVPPMVGDAGR